MKLKKTSFSAPELLEKATTLCWSREQLESVLRESESALPTIETRLRAARVQLADREATVAVDSTESSKEELAELSKILLEREAARARISGLQSKLATQEAELATVAEELAAACRDWSRDAWDRFKAEEYIPALKV